MIRRRLSSDDLNKKIQLSIYGYSVTSTTLFNNDEWYHVGFTYEGSNKIVKMYVDGLFEISTTLSIYTVLSSASTCYIGKMDNYSMSGKLSDFRIYNRVLTADEIKTVYNSKLNDNKFNKAIFYNGEIVNSSTYTDTNTVNKEPILFDTNAFILGKTLFNGTAQAGANNSITLASDSVAVDNYYNNASITITGGSGEGQTRIITSYNGSTKVAGVSMIGIQIIIQSHFKLHYKFYGWNIRRFPCL